ncbi:hypothetical protein PV10_00826 [Exophiala mesophila]|uniref:Flavoprotein oxygenase n=1 Tax=Exophiala mesophila TaxID=212818 RepID=A0A0D1ZT23_EXOME|nr:uncharacterized protein PV10_00826 [Exophiala mesophila]KIV97019.1 hypothetical protein PV10_00826 [Exophiala mesophila]
MSSPSPANDDFDEHEVFAFQHSSPQSLRTQPFSSPPAPPLTDLLVPDGYQVDIQDTKVVSDGEVERSDNPHAHHAAFDNGDVDEDRRTSTGSSVSSFPASIAQRMSLPYQGYEMPRTPTRQSMDRLRMTQSQSASAKSTREYYSAFRHPSSVRALQMRDEVMSDTHSVMRHHRRSGSQMSSFSHRSSHSTSTSPTKRSSRSQRVSPQVVSSHVRKEYPLVLLHCTILAPTLLPHTNHDEELISDLLPEAYRKRWAMLRDKFVGDSEVRSRGVLISHPKEDYELLEERLLESLELEVPRISHDHYLFGESTSGDSGFESASTSTTDEDGTEDSSCQSQCPDCGCKLRPDQVNRKWEVRVFAANGLMRAGAWAAAWQEMEKVDVEIRLWLPDEIRRDVEAKLALVEPIVDEEPETIQPDVRHGASSPYAVDTQEREREIYGNIGTERSQAEINELDKELRHERQPYRETGPPTRRLSDSVTQILLRHLQKALQDRKNVAVGILSILVLFLTLGSNRRPESQNAVNSRNERTMLGEVLTTTVTATATTTRTNLQVLTETVSVSSTPEMVSVLHESHADLAEIRKESTIKPALETAQIADKDVGIGLVTAEDRAEESLTMCFADCR